MQSPAKISEIEIRACLSTSHALQSNEMRQGTVSELNFVVLTMKTDDGLRTDTFGFAGTSARGAARLMADSLKPFFIGRDPLYREKHWHDWRMADRDSAEPHSNTSRTFFHRRSSSNCNR